MKNEFKYEIWDLPSYIMELEDKENLTDKDLENISGGIMDRKLAANVLAGLFVLTGATNLTQISASTTPATSISQNEIKNQKMNFEISKEQATEDINYVLKVLKEKHVSSIEKIPDEVTNQAKIEIENLGDRINRID